MVPNASPPSNVLIGTLYFDTDTNYYWFDGVQWQQFGGGDSYWTLSGDTLGTSYNVRLDSSFLMQAGKWHIGYAKEDQHDDNADSLVYLGYCDYNNTGKVSTIEVRKNDSDTNYYIYMYARSNKGSTQYTQTDSTIVINSENIYMPDITATGKKFEHLVGISPDGRLFPQPLSGALDSMHYYQSVTPTVFSTWKRNAVSEQLEVANPTDKIKEVYISDKRSQGLITFSFDDGFMTDYTIMKPLFLAKGVPATSSIIQIKIGDAGCMDWAEIEALQDDGWEICSHGIDAARCDTLTEAELEYVMKASRDTLIAHGMDISTFVYAGGRYSDTAMMVARKYYRAARSTIMYSPAPVEDNPFLFNDNILKTYALTSVIADSPADSNAVYNLIDSAAVNKLWLILYIHETNSADSAIISNYIDYIQAKGDSLQIVTIDQALDIRGNQVDASDGFAVNGRHVKIDGTIYKGFYPFIHTPGDTSVSDARNLFVGFAGNQTLSPAGGAVTLASRNNAIGFDALKSITTGYHNSVFGDLTMAKTTTGYQNSAYGNGALWSNTDGYSNTAIGFKSLYYNATGYQNTAIGLNSGYYSTASNNTFVGLSSGYGAASGCTGQNNAVLGALALEKFTGADGNTAVGYGAMNATTSGDYNTAIGNSALVSNTSGGQHVGIGYRAMRYNVATNPNVAVGTDAGHGSNGASTYGYCTLIGHKNSYSNRTGNYTVSIGYEGFYVNQSGTNNIGVGFRHGYNETGSYKSYWAADSTSFSNGMASGSKLLFYADMSNATKANHFMNVFARLAVGAAKTPSEMLDVTGNIFSTGTIYTGLDNIADNDATPDVSGGNIFLYQGTANSVTITDLDNPKAYAYYTIIGNSDTYTVTIADSGNFKLSGSSAVLGVNDVLVLYCLADNNYIEISRSDN